MREINSGPFIFSLLGAKIDFFNILQNRKRVFYLWWSLTAIIVNKKMISRATSHILRYGKRVSQRILPYLVPGMIWSSSKSGDFGEFWIFLAYFGLKSLKPNLYALSNKTKSRIPPSIIHTFYQLKVRFKLDSMDFTIRKFLWPQITPRSELLGLKTYCALKICSLLVKKCPFLVPKMDFYKNSQKFLRW